MAKIAMNRLTKIWKISQSMEIRLVEALIFSIFLYGAEPWAFRTPEHQKFTRLKCGVGDECYEYLGQLLILTFLF